ncbi:hypothetical protein [Lewinella sp. IMCC34183]|uniref:hypothetical protein n=1 Tax=Lewinella sp. IMCC34183 TaxID=2248762 RepID=UPI000E28041B|nr:hypothetical protein [Lewinella sp. IMCC34183]
MKQYLLPVFLFSSLFAAAQTLTIPDVTYDGPEDYAAQHDKIIEVVNHLENFPADVYTDHRQDAAAYLMTWLQGSPDVTVTVETYAAPLMGYGESLVIFMGEYAKHVIQDPEADVLTYNVAAMESVINYYRDNVDVFGRNKAFDKLAKLQEKGRLEKYIGKQLS